MQTLAVTIPVPAVGGGQGGGGSAAATAAGQQAIIQQAAETHWHRKWDPNHVSPVNTWTLYQMRKGLRELPNLVCLVLAGFQRSDTFFRPMVRLINAKKQQTQTRHCRIHVVSRSVAKRIGSDRVTFSTLWDEPAVLDQMGRPVDRGPKKGGGSGGCGEGSGVRADAANTGTQNATAAAAAAAAGGGQNDGQNVDPDDPDAPDPDQVEEEVEDDDAASDDGWMDIEAMISDSGDEDEGEEDDMIV